jgi:hypothetical protein
MTTTKPKNNEYHESVETPEENSGSEKGERGVHENAVELLEDPEVFQERIITRAEEDVVVFEHGTEARMKEMIGRAEREGGIIDPKEKENVVSLVEKARHAKDALLSHIQSRMQRREVSGIEQKSGREASQAYLSEERRRLAEEIREERARQRERLLQMESRLQGKEFDAQDIAMLASEHGKEATEEAQRITKADLLQKEDVHDEKEILSKVIDTGSVIDSIRKKIDAHYKKAEDVAQEVYESKQKTVEQTALRNDVIFVHTIQESQYKRHNEFSNIEKEVTYEDDADILLSLEPTISASSIKSGRSESGNVSGLWSEESGFILGGGDIRQASRNDMDSKSAGIKNRVAENVEENVSVAEIDYVAEKHGEAETMIKKYDGVEKTELGSTYNEFTIENPKVFGFYQKVDVIEDELFADGKFWAGNMEVKYEYADLQDMRKRIELGTADADMLARFEKKEQSFKEKIDAYAKRFADMAERGVPLYVMAPDRTIYKYAGVNEDGSVRVGKQLSSEDVATGRAGLSPKDRKELGERVLQKKVFKYEESEQEAEEIMSANSLMAQEYEEGNVLEGKDVAFTEKEIRAVFQKEQFNPKDLLDLLKRQYPKVYDQSVGVSEGYSLEEHTLMMMKQFEKYFSEEELPTGLDRNIFRLILAVHDLGKPEAVQAGGGHLQHEYTPEKVHALFDALGIDEFHTHLADIIVSRDIVGEYIQGHTGSEDVRVFITDYANKLGVTDDELFNLLTTFYKVDAGSYTSDAGGQGKLDNLFVFDHERGEMYFSPSVQEKIDKLELGTQKRLPENRYQEFDLGPKVCMKCGAMYKGVKGDTCARCGGRLEHDTLFDESTDVSSTKEDKDGEKEWHPYMGVPPPLPDDEIQKSREVTPPPLSKEEWDPNGSVPPPLS